MRKIMLKQQFTEFSVTEEEGLHKGYDRFQKILSQLNQVQARPDNDDINLKFLRALPSSWSQVALALKTRGGLESMRFDDLYNKLRSLELDVRIGHSYGVKTTAAPTHSAFIGAASSGSKLNYSNQQSIVPSVSQKSGSGYQQKDRKPSQNDKTEHGMEKTVQNQGQSPKMSKSESILKNQQSNRSRN
ncbi:hypothetical protein Tco_0101275 [Tanacetum coccineum]